MSYNMIQHVNYVYRIINLCKEKTKDSNIIYYNIFPQINYVYLIINHGRKNSTLQYGMKYITSYNMFSNLNYVYSTTNHGRQNNRSQHHQLQHVFKCELCVLNQKSWQKQTKLNKRFYYHLLQHVSSCEWCISHHNLWWEKKHPNVTSNNIFSYVQYVYNIINHGRLTIKSQYHVVQHVSTCQLCISHYTSRQQKNKSF